MKIRCLLVHMAFKKCLGVSIFQAALFVESLIIDIFLKNIPYILG